MSKILIINSSLRTKSNSTLLGAHVAAGAKSKGHEVESVDIGKLRIDPCLGCLLCLRPDADFCVNKDDMHPLYRRISAADALVCVSPIYWFNVCGQLKQFLDRCFAVAANADPQGKSPFASKTLCAVLTYGGNDPFDSGAVNAIRSFQDICTYTGARWAGAVYGSTAEEEKFNANTPLFKKAEKLGASL